MTTPPSRTAGRRIESYAAVGDCLDGSRETRGCTGSHADWADQLAALLAQERPDGTLRYTKLAGLGQSLDQIVGEQLPAARRFAPDLVSFRAGGIELLRPRSDPEAIAERVETAVAELCAHTRTVLLFTGFDPRPIPVLRHLRDKLAAYTTHLRAVADRHGCPLVDLWSMPALHDRQAWSEDGMNLSPPGHGQVAAQAARVLGLRHTVADGRPPRQAAGCPPAETPRTSATWERDYFAPWLARPFAERHPARDATARGPNPPGQDPTTRPSDLT